MRFTYNSAAYDLVYVVVGTGFSANDNCWNNYDYEVLLKLCLRVEFWRGRKYLSRGKPLFASFKKTREKFWGVFKGFICLILKFPQIGGFWGVIIIIFFLQKQLIQNSLFLQNNLLRSLFKKQLIQNNLFIQKYLLRSLFQK